MDRYYKNFLWLFTNPVKSFKRFSKDGMKMSIYVFLTFAFAASIIQYIISFAAGDFSGVASPYEIIAALPLAVIFTVAFSLIVVLITAYLSAFCAKLFFKGTQKWKQTFILLNYVSIISYIFSIPLQISGYLAFSTVTYFIISAISIIFTLRAAGMAVSKTTKTTFFQGLIVYFMINMIISIPFFFLASMISPVA